MLQSTKIGAMSRQAAKGLGQRECVVCGTVFQPYRAHVLTCSRACYRQSPAWKEVQRRSDARPERRARSNELRRGTERVRDYNRKKQLARYGLTPDDHDRMLAEQDGKCAICGQPPKPDGVKAASRLHADHDHTTGRARALICLHCNGGLGYFRDDPALLRAAAAYIERHRSVPPP